MEGQAEHAVQAGSKLLQSYTAKKASSRKSIVGSDVSCIETSMSMYYDAVADGNSVVSHLCFIIDFKFD